MTAIAALLGLSLGAFLPAGASANEHIDPRAGGAFGDALRKVDALEVLASSAPAREAFAEACVSSMTAGDPSALFHFIPWDQGVYENSLTYVACLALAAGGPAPCAVLRPVIYENYTFDQRCISEYRAMRFISAMRRGSPDAQALCEEFLRIGIDGNERQFKIEAVPKACRVIQEHRTDPVGACERLIKPEWLELDPLEGGYSYDNQDCMLFMKTRVRPVVASCKVLADNYDTFICSEYAASERAIREGKPDSCGDAGVCRLLMGGPKDSCEVYRRRGAAAFCGTSDAPGLGFARLGDEAKAALDQLDAASAASPSPSLEHDRDRLRERFQTAADALRLRLNVESAPRVTPQGPR